MFKKWCNRNFIYGGTRVAKWLATLMLTGSYFGRIISGTIAQICGGGLILFNVFRPVVLCWCFYWMLLSWGCRDGIPTTAVLHHRRATKPIEVNSVTNCASWLCFALLLTISTHLLALVDVKTLETLWGFHYRLTDRIRTKQWQL